MAFATFGTLPAVCGGKSLSQDIEDSKDFLLILIQFVAIQLVFPPKFPHACATEASLQLRYFLGLFWRETKICRYPSVPDTATGDTLVQLPYHKSETVFWRGLICDFHAFTHIINKGRCNTMASSASASFFKV